MSRPGLEPGRWVAFGLVLLCVPAAAWWGFSRLQVESDVLEALPRGEARLDSARQVLELHPALEQVVVDLDAGEADSQRLLAAADFCRRAMSASGLFSRVGLEDAQQDFAGLLAELPARLPYLFDAEQLAAEVAPRLEEDAIRLRLSRVLEELGSLSGLGQAELLAADPLGLHELVLARLAALSPSPGARIRGGHLVSADGRHALLLAEPKGRAADTQLARRIEALMQDIQADLDRRAGSATGIRLRALGSWRAALDNERMARDDTQRAVWIATAGILLLLLLCFPRPWLGLLALLPAVAGVSLALLVFSWFEERISALALGFGGALVAITVDHGIAFLQFLDSGQVEDGRGAARRVWSVGLFATLTTAGAFAALSLSGFSILAEVGVFAALGVVFAFVFVHGVMPRLMPRAPIGRKRSLLPVERWLDRLGGQRRPYLALALGLGVVIGLLAWGTPRVSADLRAMNSVSAETREAEQTLERVWGQVGQGPALMLEADSQPALMRAGQRIAPLLARAHAEGQIEAIVTPWDLAPRGALARERLRAWLDFFSPERCGELGRRLGRAGAELGFAEDAFAPFLAGLRSPAPAEFSLPPGVFDALGGERQGASWRWFGSLHPGQAYQAEILAARLEQAQVAFFEPTLFSNRLGELLGETFQGMVARVGLAVLILLLLLFADLALVFITALPLVFAWGASFLGLRLLDHPLDLPSLMLAVVVLGMGVDYALYLVRGQQRFLDCRHPGLGPVRVTVLLAGGSTLIGMLSLLSADHLVPRSAGVSTALGIGLALLGAFVFLPPLLNHLFRARPFPVDVLPLGSRAHARALRRRYQHLEPGFRYFARFKLAADPMFPRLADWVDDGQRLLDIGCGLAVPATWLALARRDLRVVGLEPLEDRARVAARALGERGSVHCGQAPDLSCAEGVFDAILMLDMIHHLDDQALAETLALATKRLRPGGRLILRASLPEQGRSLERRVEEFRLAWRGAKARWRSRKALEALLAEAGLALELVEAARPNRCEWWFVARFERGPS